jgi:hypothetical protein
MPGYKTVEARLGDPVLLPTSISLISNTGKCSALHIVSASYPLGFVIQGLAFHNNISSLCKSSHSPLQIRLNQTLAQQDFFWHCL